jgi:hypothetical protein
MIIRFSAFHQALRGGQFHVRFLDRLNHGYGYPVANFLYPGFMYLAEPFKLAGLGFVNSIKMISGLSLLASAIFTYLWLSKRFSLFGAFMGALFYLYTPYHLYDIYRRGSVGEILALAVAPFIFWQIERKSFFWTALGIGVLILSHNTLAVLFMPLILLYIVLPLYKDKTGKQQLYKYIGIFVTALGLSAFFWLPAVFELHYTKFSSIQVSDFQKYFAESSLIGGSSLMAIGVSLFVLYKQRKDSSLNRLFLLFIITSIVSVIFATPYGHSLWDVLPTAFIQFPFRTLSYLIIAVSFIVAYTITYYDRTAKLIISMLFIIVLLYSTQPFLQPKEYFDKGEGFYATNEDSTTVKNEYMPKWVKQNPLQHPARKVVSLDKTLEVPDVTVKPGKILITTKVKNTTELLVNTIYYPGWHANAGGKDIPIVYNNNYGIIGIKVPPGQTDVAITFSETPLRLFADMLSLFSMAGLFVYFFIFPKRKIALKKHV